mmetsp:Transcript_48802/g.147040  ORF Transcript_48802/g.147040 Transcript_48802/m.147040 type:complete len:238 (+) Transcript_48802:2461-3174(+)
MVDELVLTVVAVDSVMSDLDCLITGEEEPEEDDRGDGGAARVGSSSSSSSLSSSSSSSEEEKEWLGPTAALVALTVTGTAISWLIMGTASSSPSTETESENLTRLRRRAVEDDELLQTDLLQTDPPPTDRRDDGRDAIVVGEMDRSVSTRSSKISRLVLLGWLELEWREGLRRPPLEAMLSTSPLTIAPSRSRSMKPFLSLSSILKASASRRSRTSSRSECIFVRRDTRTGSDLEEY